MTYVLVEVARNINNVVESEINKGFVRILQIKKMLTNSYLFANNLKIWLKCFKNKGCKQQRYVNILLKFKKVR